MALHQRFQNQHYMNVPQAKQLAKDLNLTYQQVKTWFQNRRMKHKKLHKESLWVNQGSRLLPVGSQPGEHMGTSPLFSQAHPGGTLQRCAGHPYQNHARMQSTHQTILQKDRPMGLQRQRILQSLGPQQSMDMFQNYQVVEYQSSRQADGYNFTPPLSYPSGTPCQQYYYQQHQQLHCNHYQSMPHRKYESMEQKEPQGYQITNQTKFL